MDTEQTHDITTDQPTHSIFDATDDVSQPVQNPAKNQKKPVIEKDEQPTEKENERLRNKEDNHETNDVINEELEQYKKRYKDSKEWGQKTNMTLVNAKKKTTDLLKKLRDEGSIYEDQYNEAVGYFQGVDNIENNVVGEKEIDPHIQIKENLDKEFQMFKKYNKIADAEEKYNAFFSFLSFSNPDEIEKTVNYMQEEPTDKVLEYIMSVGEDLYEDLYKGIEQSGDILTYVKSLKSEKNKLAEKVKHLQTELDGTTDKVYTRSINSKVSRSEYSRDNGKPRSIFDPE